jgi:hypothetical protein
MRHLYLLGFAVAGALAVAGTVQAAPMNGAASLATAAIADQASPEAVIQVQDRRYHTSRRYSTRSSGWGNTNIRRTVDHGWRTGSYSRRAYPQQTCL